MINLSPVDGVSGMYNLGDADDVSSTESDQDVETVKTASADAAQPQHDNPFKGFNITVNVPVLSERISVD